MLNIPSNYTLLFSAGQIQERTSALGAEITEWAVAVKRDTSKEVVAVPLMKGAMFFASDLMREIKTSLEIMPLRVSHYRAASNARSSELLITPEEDFEVKGRTLLLIDDIFDSGITLAGVQLKLMERGATEIKSVVAVHRKLEGLKGKPEWSAFQHQGKEWLVGYGMDDKNQSRNLNAIYSIKGSGA